MDANASGKLRLGIPKGSLEDATIELFKQAGWSIAALAQLFSPASTTLRSSAHWCVPKKWVLMLLAAHWMQGYAGWIGSWRLAPRMMSR